jgi:hypothetical protein
MLGKSRRVARPIPKIHQPGPWPITWDGAGNAYYELWTQTDGQLHINLPKWSAVMFRRK